MLILYRNNYDHVNKIDLTPFMDSIRCGDRVVSTGDSRMEVQSKCGPPDYEETVSYKTSGSVSSGGGRLVEHATSG